MSYVGAVDVAVNPSQRRHLAQFVGDGNVAEVAGMPYFVALCEVLGIAVVPMRVGVGEDAYAFHWEGNQEKSLMYVSMAWLISLTQMNSSAEWERELSPGPSLKLGKRMRAWSDSVGDPNGSMPS